MAEVGEHAPAGGLGGVESVGELVEGGGELVELDTQSGLWDPGAVVACRDL